FLGGETRGVALVAGKPARLAILDLTGSEDTGAKALARRGPSESALDTIDFDDVDTGACYLAHREMSISRAAGGFNCARTLWILLFKQNPGGSDGEAFDHGKQNPLHRQ